MILATVLFCVMLAVWCGWQEWRMRKMEKKVNALQFWQGSDVSRQEFDAMKGVVQRLRRKQKNAE